MQSLAAFTRCRITFEPDKNLYGQVFRLHEYWAIRIIIDSASDTTFDPSS